MTLAGSAMFTTLRVYALSNRNKILGTIVLLLSFTPFLVTISTAYQSPPINLPSPENCTSRNTVVSMSVSLG
ncbi:hypothetical protein C2E23DRAFT_503446 [Lenzites betulinus]|nr:hypothetical protein C2E23DRAFT_503446 [Lenzites betulinus]